MAPQSPNTPQVAQHDSLYTTLLIVAAVMLLVGVIFLATSSVNMLGSLLPPGGG